MAMHKFSPYSLEKEKKTSAISSLEATEKRPSIKHRIFHFEWRGKGPKGSRKHSSQNEKCNEFSEKAPPGLGPLNEWRY